MLYNTKFFQVTSKIRANFTAILRKINLHLYLNLKPRKLHEQNV